MLLVEGTTSEPGGSRKPTTRKKITEEGNGSKAKATSVLDDLIQQGARQIIQQAVEAELAGMLERYSNVKSIDGRRAVVRNGYRLCPDGCEFPCCERDYPFLTQTHLPNA